MDQNSPQTYFNSQTPLRQLFSSKQRPLLPIIISSVIILIIAIFSLLYFTRAGKYKVRIQYAPSFAEVKIDDKKYKNNSSAYITPGEHTVSVNAPEFETTTYQLSVDKDTQYIFGALSPATVLGNELATKKLIDEFLDIERIGNQVIKQASANLAEQYPILTHLPKTEEFREGKVILGYTLSDHTLTIDAKNFTNPDNTSFYIMNGVDQLISLANKSNKPIAEYKVQIENFTNPFADIQPSSESDPKSFLKKSVSNLKINQSLLTYNEDFRQDNIYYTTISWDTQVSRTPIIYRVALIQDGNSWKFAGPPYPIATTDNMPNVPINILTTLNNIQVKY